MLFAADLVDESRRKKALSGELTPFEMDLDNKVFRFSGSEGNVYTTTLDECTCTDFSLNLGQQRPCKHMIRAAMELGIYSSDGIVRDPDAASARYYLGLLRTYIHDAPLIEAIRAEQIVESIVATGTSSADDALSFAGVPSLSCSGLFTTKGKKARITPTKQTQKSLDGLQRTLIIRLGTMLYDNLNYEPIMSMIKNFSALNDGE